MNGGLDLLKWRVRCSQAGAKPAFYLFNHLNAHEHDYIMCNAQFQGHKNRDIASICCMCPN